jgi:Fe-S-cluster containining protein
METDSPLKNESLPIFSLDDNFTFSCHKGLKCFNSCCSNINLYLTPYDIVRMKKRLGISSEEFLQKYTIPLFMKEIGHPLIILRMLDDMNKICPFVSKKGCTIYEDRPWSCRIYPLDPISRMSSDLSSGKRVFTIVDNKKCEGFNSIKKQSVKKWIETQNVALYEKMMRLWAEITLHDKMELLEYLDETQQAYFYMASFNVDIFRKFVLSNEFSLSYEIDKKLLSRLKKDDVELLKFGFQWLKHMLFGESTLKKKSR